MSTTEPELISTAVTNDDPVGPNPYEQWLNGDIDYNDLPGKYKLYADQDLAEN